MVENTQLGYVDLFHTEGKMATHELNLGWLNDMQTTEMVNACPSHFQSSVHT